MKKITLILTIAICAITISAQCKFDPEKFKAELKHHIIATAHLTDKEAARFFPLFEEMQNKQRNIHQRIRQLQKTKPANDAKARNIIIQTDNLRIQKKQIEQQYHNKMMKLIPATKLNEALKAERRFHKQYFKNVAK